MKPFSPQPNADTYFFWKATKDKKLVFKKCKNCGFVLWPPSELCPICHSTELETIVSKGSGKIYSFSVYRVAFHEYFEKKVPYIVAVVKLEEGVHILSNIVNCSPENVSCDMEVKVVWERAGEFNIPKFEPAKN